METTKITTGSIIELQTTKYAARPGARAIVKEIWRCSQDRNSDTVVLEWLDQTRELNSGQMDGVYFIRDFKLVS